MNAAQIARLFGDARRSHSQVVVEGFHAVKHAMRFGAEFGVIATAHPAGLGQLAATLAPDVAAAIMDAVTVVPAETFAQLCPVPPKTGVAAVAHRREASVESVLGNPGSAPVVYLEQPRHLGNLGAAIRVSAAAGAAGIITSGPADPWDPAAIRGAAGLQYALPIARVDEMPHTVRSIAAIDPGGLDLAPGTLPARAVLAFGGERSGLGDGILERAACRVRIPMQPGVSSLNLATAVAVVLYAAAGGDQPR